MSNQEQPEDHGLFNIADDPRAVALDMAIRGAIAPHLQCACGLGPSMTSGVLVHILGIIAFQGGVPKEIVDAEDNNFWDGMKANFREGFDTAKEMAEAQRRAVN